jgi:hypothetical protein
MPAQRSIRGFLSEVLGPSCRLDEYRPAPDQPDGFEAWEWVKAKAWHEEQQKSFGLLADDDEYRPVDPPPAVLRIELGARRRDGPLRFELHDARYHAVWVETTYDDGLHAAVVDGQGWGERIALDRPVYGFLATRELWERALGELRRALSAGAAAQGRFASSPGARRE